MKQLFIYPKVSVVVPVFNAKLYLKECIEHLLRQKYPSEQLELIMVDNRSTDGSKELILAQKSIRYVFCDRPGPSAARNEGFKQATGQIILLTDADCMAGPEWVLTHVKSHFYFQHFDPAVKLIGGGIDGKNSNYWALCDDYCSWYINFPGLEPAIVPYYATANLSLRREVLDDLCFDEELFSGEDYDFCTRALSKGHRIFFEPEAKIGHCNRPSFAAFMAHPRNWTVSECKLREKGTIVAKEFPTVVHLYIRIVTCISMIKRVVCNSIQVGRYSVLLCLPFIAMNKVYLCYHLLKTDLAYKKVCRLKRKNGLLCTKKTS